MCSSPITICNKSRYRNLYLSPVEYYVPCGHCADCRSTRQSDWRVRLAHEISFTYDNGGTVLMLLLSYNNEHLPTIAYPQSDGKLSDPTPCFSREDITFLLNNVRTYIYEHYNKASFRFYLASEYGEHFKRPHYHVIFFLSVGLDPHDFYDVVLKFWQEKGFLFPKRVSHGVYSRYNKVKKCHEPAYITLKSLKGSANYVSKYVTKDLSYFRIPAVNDFYYNVAPKLRKKMQSQEVLRFYKRSLPFFRCSKGLGYCMASGKSMSELKDMILNGVSNPITLRVEKFPSSILRRLMYRNVKTDRVSLLTGKPIYEPHLSCLGRRLMPSVLRARYSTYSDSYRKIMSNRVDLVRYCSLAGVDYCELNSLFTECEQFFKLIKPIYSIFDGLSTLKIGTSSLSDFAWCFLHTYGLENDIFDFEVVLPYLLLEKKLPDIEIINLDDVVSFDWLERKHKVYDSEFHYVSPKASVFYKKMLMLLSKLDDIRIVVNSLNAEAREKEFNEITRVKSIFY